MPVLLSFLFGPNPDPCGLCTLAARRTLGGCRVCGCGVVLVPDRLWNLVARHVGAVCRCIDCTSPESVAHREGDRCLGCDHPALCLLLRIVASPRDETNWHVRPSVL